MLKPVPAAPNRTRSPEGGLLLFSGAGVPDAVWNEVVVAGKGDRAAQKIPSIDWLIKLPSVTVDL